MYYKTYSRLDSIELKKEFGPKNKLQKLFLSRRSFHNFSGKSIYKRQMSELLYFSAGLIEISTQGHEALRRPYPSAGAKYPLEIYLLVLKNSDLKKGLYHYNVLEHSLDVLVATITLDDIQNIWMTQKWFKKASIIVIITMIPDRTTRKYGNKGLEFCLLEAGHLGQNIALYCEHLGIGCSSIGEFKKEKLIELLDINPDEEQPVYYLGLGN